MIPKICLNMIVKNESKIIMRLLESVLNIIDSYCICDTGSTDNTIEIITNFFSKTNIQGKILYEPFKNFGYNRSIALNACKNMPNADYILLLDADMQLKLGENITPQTIKQYLVHELYYVFQGNEFIYYKNIRLVKNNLNVYYWGVTHEFLKVADNDYKYNEFPLNILFVYDVGDGGSKTNKYTRDIELLKNGLIELPDNDRYLFYLANSYRDNGQFEMAIQTYLHRIKIGGWIEETWQCHYSIGKCAMLLNNIPFAIYHYLEAYQLIPSRLENLYEIVFYYRNNMKYDLAYHFYTMIDEERKKFKGVLDFLFLERDVYDWKIDYEFTIIAFYKNKLPYDINKICMNVLSYSLLDYGYSSNIIRNYKFYSKKLIDYSNPLSDNLSSLLKNIVNCNFALDGFISSTPSFCFDSHGNIISNQRMVNYRIADDGTYINQKCIETINVLSFIHIITQNNNKNILKNKWIKTKENIINYNKSYDNVYVGLEDIRFFLSKSGIIYYNANRGLASDKMRVEFGIIDNNGNTIESTILSYNFERNIEKNWVMFDDIIGNIKMIYGWYPLIIGSIVESTNAKERKFIETHNFKTPNFFQYLRGSTNGYTIDDEIWFICHIVSYEIKRYYYHIIVVLDKNTFKLKCFSPFFTFEGCPIEYCLSFFYIKDNNELFIGYSIFDRETKYITINKNYFVKQFII